MSLKKRLDKSVNEKDVENIYRDELSKTAKSQITSPYSVDGLLEAGNIRSLLEFKYKEQLKNKLSQCNILIQCLYYLKKFEINGEKLPTTIFVGDVNECFALHTNSIVKYLSHEIDWKVAPSDAYKKNAELIHAMVNDIDILPFVFDVTEEFHIKTVIDSIKEFSNNIIRKVRVTQNNITTIFDYFEKNVLEEKIKISTNEKANLFIQIIINPNENYLHPKKKNILSTKSFGDLIINQNLFSSFFRHFEGDVYSPKEKDKLSGLVDRLVEDVTRRKKGEFFTPALFVDLAHEYISNAFGADWKEKYVVWDCAAGTLNLTRDYKFKELYCSTLEQSDLDTAEQMGYNQEGTKFKYDFLNDWDENLPKGLKKAISSGKEILFFINPPYATANNMGAKGDHKGGIADTMVSKKMKADEWGSASQSLYAQFIYRIAKYQKINKNIKIGLFSPPLYLSGSSYYKFREKFFELFGFETGFLFEASHFSDVSKGWGISFSVLSNKINNKKYILDVVELNDSFSLTSIGKKEIYNTDDKRPASEWVREEIKGLKTFDAPQIASSITVKQSGRGKSVNGHLGYFGSNGNSIYDNNTYVFLLSECGSRANGISIIKENFSKCVTLFAARKLISGDYSTWINCKDEYLAPNESHPAYQQFTIDAIVYSLFNNSSQQSSLRQINYKGKKWDIKNEFFWLQTSIMKEIAENNNYDELYRDAKSGEERHVYNMLFKEGIYKKLSPDAKEVLDMATDLLKKSIPMRKLVSENHPEYHLDSFDAGYAQLRIVLKEYFKDEFKLFRDDYKKLEDRMRPLVYELGFLKT